MPAVDEWLLDGPSWIQYRTRVDLLDEPVDHSGFQREILEDPGVRNLLAELETWPAPPLNSHKSAGHPIHKMVFLADLGLSMDNIEIRQVADKVLAYAAADGPFRVMMNIPQHFGGSGEDGLAWALCDAPLSLYALASFGLRDHPAVRTAAEFLVGLVQSNGWPCAVSPELGKFRGPGKKDDPCPYANLVMLQALAQFPAYRDSDAARTGVEAALTCWGERRERHPYMFFMGTDFCKLKVPLVWYDLLHVMDVLTRFPWALDDRRLLDMVDILASKVDFQGRYTIESMWTAWKDWEFGQKKVPSRWLTLLALRTLKRLG